MSSFHKPRDLIWYFPSLEASRPATTMPPSTPRRPHRTRRASSRSAQKSSTLSVSKAHCPQRVRTRSGPSGPGARDDRIDNRGSCTRRRCVRIRYTFRFARGLCNFSWTRRGPARAWSLNTTSPGVIPDAHVAARLSGRRRRHGRAHALDRLEPNRFGPVAEWPQSLRTAISILLESRFAMVVAWGPQFPFLLQRSLPSHPRDKTPAALGARGAEIIPEVWSVVGPEFERVRGGEAFAVDDWLVPLDRNGYLENCWFTLSYSPIRDESGGVGRPAGGRCGNNRARGRRAPARDAPRAGALRGRGDDPGTGLCQCRRRSSARIQSTCPSR